MVEEARQPHERPPEEREETHLLEQRRAEGRTPLRNAAARIALEYATAVTVAIDPERGETPSHAGFEHVDGDTRSWSNEPFAGDPYRVSLPDGRAAAEALLDSAALLWEFVVHTDESWLYRTHGWVNVSATGPDYERDLRTLADERGAVLVPLTTLGRWTDGQRWYEITDGHLSIYPDDIAGKSWEERQKYTTHGSYPIAGIECIHITESEMTIELSWGAIEDDSPFMRAVGAVIGTIGAALPIPEAPTEMDFDSQEAFATAVETLLTAVNRGSCDRTDGV
jgi:hypothetical protein